METSHVPVLDARSGGPARRFAERMSGRHPAVVFAAALLAGFAMLALLGVALGLLVTDVLLHSGGVADADEDAVRSIVSERTPLLTDASWVGTMLGGAPLLPVLVGAIALVCAFLRRWLIAAFAVFALTVESATYRVTSLVAPRERPDVKRLEDLPVDASFPSGHTAASVAVYAGLAVLITSRFPSGRPRAIAWTVAVLVPAIVALSRMYRGMHHPLDVAGGLVVGIGALLVLLFACRAASAAQEARSPGRARVSTSRRAQPVA
jgi:membrane-associated phospholipid phosphatase